MLTKRKEFGYVLLLLVVSVFLYILFVKKIEVVAPGTGLTGIKESNVNLKAPESSYIVEIVSSQGTEIRTGEPLLRYRNMADEYQLDQITQELNIDKRIFQELEDERCFLLSDRFSDSKIEQLKRGCSGDETTYGAGGLYILSFYEDYLQEKKYLLDMAIERQKKAEELLNKRKILATKQAIHRKANGSTLRFYDLKTELSDLNSEIVSFDISNLENQKKLSDKLMVFQMRRSERLLTIDEKLDTLQMEIIQKENELSLLSEKKQKSLIRSPIDGTVLEMTEGLSVGTFVQEGSSLFVLKKEGASQEVSAKFDTKYRHFLNVGRDVKLKINSPGFNKVFSGRISELSSDSLAYEEQNQSGKRYYRVTIEPDQEFVDLSLNLGMDVQVFVIDDEVSVFGFILSVLPSDIRFDVW